MNSGTFTGCQYDHASFSVMPSPPVFPHTRQVNWTYGISAPARTSGLTRSIGGVPQHGAAVSGSCIKENPPNYACKQRRGGSDVLRLPHHVSSSSLTKNTPDPFGIGGGSGVVTAEGIEVVGSNFVRIAPSAMNAGEIGTFAPLRLGYTGFDALSDGYSPVVRVALTHYERAAILPHLTPNAR